MIIKSIAARLANHPAIIDEQDGTAAKSSRNRDLAEPVTTCLSISCGSSQECQAVMDAARTGAPCQVGTHAMPPSVIATSCPSCVRWGLWMAAFRRKPGDPVATILVLLH